MTTQETPHGIDRLLASDTLQALADSPHAPIQLFGLAAQDGVAIAAGVIDSVDKRVGTREDEQGMPFMDRLLDRAFERTEVIEQPVLREVAGEAVGAVFLGYTLADNVVEFAQNRVDKVGEFARQALGNIQQ